MIGFLHKVKNSRVLSKVTGTLELVSSYITLGVCKSSRGRGRGMRNQGHQTKLTMTGK
jgi:hypothetical protein